MEEYADRILSPGRMVVPGQGKRVTFDMRETLCYMDFGWVRQAPATDNDEQSVNGRLLYAPCRLCAAGEMVISARLSGTDLPDLCRLACSGVQGATWAPSRSW